MSTSCGTEYWESVLATGVDWQLKNIQGYATDDGGQYYNENVYMLQNSSGIYNAPMPYEVQDDLYYATEPGDTVFVVNQRIVDEISLSLQQGYLTPELQAIAEPGEGGMEPYPEPYSTYESDSSGKKPKKSKKGELTIQGSCSSRAIHKSKTFNISTPLNQDFNLGGGFSGSLSATGDIQGSGTGEVNLSLKRFGIFGVCIPYAVKFNNARAYGGVAVNYGATLSGTVNYTYNWEDQLAKPFLFSLNFAIGPVPVHIGFNLPIDMGLNLQANVTGSVSYNGAQTATGNFDYTCTLNGCSGWSGYDLSNAQTPQPFLGEVSGRIQPTIWVQAGVRAYLYTEWLAYAQLGVRPYLYGDLWGYYGNNCGDADADGYYETVDALTFDLDWQLYLTGQAAAFGGNPKKWNDLWHTNRRHLRFWDLIGSDALRPMLAGAATAPLNTSLQYSAKMRPCWPYPENVSYSLNWGDGTSTAALNGAAQTWTSAAHAWSQQGAVGLTLTANNDAHGRSFGAATSRTVQVTSSSGTWTSWLNRDDPSGSGDWETLNEFVSAGQVCSNPIAIECQTTAGVDWSQSGEVYTCDVAAGGICRVENQSDGACFDYRVRFLCPSSGPVTGAFSYSATNTNSAQQSTVNHNVTISAGQTIQFGTCTVSGSSGSGDTYLRLYAPNGTHVAANDDSCGLLSYASHTATQSGTYQIRAGCYSSGSCSGTVAYTIQ